MVIATQNPIEQEGTYPLPEAQLDRFLFKIEVGYPSLEEEQALVKLHGHRTAMPRLADFGVTRGGRPAPSCSRRAPIWPRCGCPTRS